MTCTEKLAALARQPLGADEAAALRSLTLTNIAAAAGERGAVASMTDRLPLDGARPADGAFLLAARLHARTQDDFYPEGRVHVGAIALAATLALADEVGERTMDCLAAGYRVMCAVSAGYAAEAQRVGLRPSGVFGPFGAAAAAATALGCSAAQTGNAIGLAAAACGGHNQAWISGSDEWVLEVGAAARAGVEAALFGVAGARAAPDAFEGPAGWAAALLRDPGASTLTSGLTGPPVGAQNVAVKPYPVSGIAQVPTALACDLHASLAGTTPRAVRVRMSDAELGYPGSANTGPFPARSAALMSVAFCVACGLSDGVIRLARLENPHEVPLLDLVEVTADPAVAEHEARVEVDLDGEILRRTGRARELLFPVWTDAAPAEIARRSEADEGVVRAAAAELSRERPRADVLRGLTTGSLSAVAP